jgi:hypothetical protein
MPDKIENTTGETLGKAGVLETQTSPQDLETVARRVEGELEMRCDEVYIRCDRGYSPNVEARPARQAPGPAKSEPKP